MKDAHAVIIDIFRRVGANRRCYEFSDGKRVSPYMVGGCAAEVLNNQMPGIRISRQGESVHVIVPSSAKAPLVLRVPEFFQAVSAGIGHTLEPVPNDNFDSFVRAFERGSTRDNKHGTVVEIEDLPTAEVYGCRSRIHKLGGQCTDYL